MNLYKKPMVICIISALIMLPAWSKGMAHGGAADAVFIDSMIIHHYASMDMAEQALKQSSRPEITGLAKEIIVSQAKELEQLKSWMKAWYPHTMPTGGGMGGVDIGSMKIGSDMTKPFDLRFIEAMIPLQEGCIKMAQEGLSNAQHEEITIFATNTISSQKSRLKQLKQWKKDWFKK